MYNHNILIRQKRKDRILENAKTILGVIIGFILFYSMLYMGGLLVVAYQGY